MYKETAQKTLAFMIEEWMGAEACFYSALDADSEGVEGKYYVWTKEELRDLLKEDFDLFSDLYSVNEKGYWEDGNYILMRNEDRAAIALKYSISSEELKSREEACKNKLLKSAEDRVKPGLDDKSITAWNALLCRAFCKAYAVFGDEQYKEVAVRNMRFIMEKMSNSKGGLLRAYKKGVSKVPAFLDDYAFVISALIECSVICADENYLKKADELLQYVLLEFNNPDSHFLYYTDRNCDLIMRSSETSDNVIPASNSEMAMNLFYLGKYLDKPEYLDRSLKMLETVQDEIERYGPGYSNWALLALKNCYPFCEVAIVGNNVDEIMKELSKQGLTNTILATAHSEQLMPLVKNRYVHDKTIIYVCRNKTCDLPTEELAVALKQIESEFI